MMEASPFSEGHPLLSHVVLHRLFKLMKFDIYQFAKLRLVCRQWYKESLPIWRKNVVLCASDTSVLFEDYLELLEEPDSFYQMRKYPYCNYHVYRCYIRFRGRSGDLSTRFWTKVGPLMTHLTIRLSRFFQAEDLRKVIFELTPNLRYLGLHENEYNENRAHLKEFPKKPIKVQANLVEFEVELEHWEPPEAGKSASKQIQVNLTQQLPISWMEIFSHFPNLKVLDLQRLCPENPGGELGLAVKALKTIRRKVGQEYFAGLEKLLVDSADSGTALDLSPIIVENICELQLRLKKLTFDVGLGTEAGTFIKLVEAHSQTLKSLGICKGRFSPPFQTLSFQNKFEFLAHLKLVGPILPNLNFIQNMPNLETLRLQDNGSGNFSPNAVEADLHELGYLQHNFEDLELQLEPPSKMIGNTDFLQLEGQVLHKMKQLYIGEEICSGKHVAELAKLMPNLTCLRLGLGDDGFRIVCQTWEKLEALDIHPCQVTKETKTKTGRKFHLREILPLWCG